MRTSALLFLALLASRPASAQQLRVYFIDVDQADATLIVAPGGGTLLIDSGRNGHGGRLRAAMQAAGVTRIDHFVATHYHEDHYGGIDDLVNAGTVVVNAYDRGDKAFVDADRLQSPTWIGYDTTVGHRADHLTRGETIPLDADMLVTVIASGGVVLGELDPEPGHEENDMSIGLLVTYGDFRLWVGGDVEEPTERKIAERDLVMDLDVYQANHHGADNGSSQAFLEDMRPSAIVISNGSNRIYDHPRRTTLVRMQGLSPAPTIFQLNKYVGGDPPGGNVADAFIADPETVDEDGTIVLTVDPSAGTYEVSYGTSRHTFAIKGRGGGSVVIESLLPDPTSGADRTREEVTLRNRATTSVSMQGWVLRDASGRIWSLAGLGSIGAGAGATIRRDGMAMSLNNAGPETIELIDAGGAVVDSFAYDGSEPGVRIDTGH